MSNVKPMELHGHVNFYWENNVLYVEAFGPFNEEGVYHCIREYSKIIKERKVDHFSINEIWDEASLGSPAVMKLVKEFWKSIGSHHCLSIAVVISNCIQQLLCQELLPDNGRVFEEKRDAEEWTLQSLRKL